MFADHKIGRRFGMVAALTICSAVASPVAATTTISSGAFGVYANLSITPLIGASLGPIASVSGTAGSAYNASNTALSLTQSLALGNVTSVLGSGPGLLSGALNQTISTGLITTSASSAFPATMVGNSSAQVSNIALDLGINVPLGARISLFTISASTIGSTSSVDGTVVPSAAGGSVLNNLALGGLLLNGGTISGGATLVPTADYTFLDYLGIKVVLNEQVKTGDLAASAGITTNSLHASFKDILVSGGLLNGDIIISQSRASFMTPTGSAVPEPAIWAQMIAGFSFVGLITRRRRARSLAAG